MASTATMQARAKARKAAGKERISDSAVNRQKAADFRSSTSPSIMMVDESKIQTPQYKDLDVDYECFVEYLNMLDIDWKTVAANGLTGECMICLNTDNLKYQKAFVLPATTTCANGEPVIEFAVLGGIWYGIKGVLDMVSKQVGKPMRVITAAAGADVLRFAIMVE
jgi:hypothetical protein